jgi:hypothetical protein
MPILDRINIRLSVLEHWMAKNCPEEERHMIQALVESMHEASNGAPNTVTPVLAGSLPLPKTLTTLSRDDYDNIGREGLMGTDSSDDEEEYEHDSEDDVKPAANPNIKSSNNKNQPVNETDPKKLMDMSSSAKRKGETLLEHNLKTQPGTFLESSDDSAKSSKKGDSPIIYDLEKDNDPKGKRPRANDGDNE